MKHYLTKTILALATLLCSMNCWAVKVTINGINYTIYADYCSVTTSNVSGDIVIPESIEYNGNYYPVKTIESLAFYNCSGITSVRLPPSITSIGEKAFMNCTNLSSINIPDLLTKIENKVFYGCTDLNEIAIPYSVTSIGDQSFQLCLGLKKNHPS